MDPLVMNLFNKHVFKIFLHFLMKNQKKQGKKAFALSATRGFWILIKAKNEYKMNIVRVGLGDIRNAKGTRQKAKIDALRLSKRNLWYQRLKGSC